jgi:hypothetical protein
LWTIFKPIQSLRLTSRWYGVGLVFAAGLLVNVAEKVSPQLRQHVAEKAAASAAAAAQAEAEDPLKNITIDSFRGEKGGFGSVMKATFVIINRNKFAVKDVEVTCTHRANSGSVIDSNRRTIYERIKAGGNHAVVDFNMGFIHSQANSTNCRVTGYVPV